VGRLGRFVRYLEVGWMDVVLALGLSVVAVATGPGSEGVAFSPAVLLCTAPLLLRRRWPIFVLLLALAGFLIAGNASNLAALVGGLVAAVSVGLDERHPFIGGAAVFAVAATIAFEFGHGSYTELPIPGFLTPFLLIGAAFLAGRVVASGRLQLRQQRERGDALERDHANAIKEAAEAERRHIARELHDVIAHSVGVMVVQAGAARHVLTEKPEAARESLLAVETSGHAAMSELRRLLGVLGTGENGEAPPLAPQAGIANLEALVAHVRDAGLPVDLTVEGASRPVPPGVDVAAYRIVQEALTNALKYAGGAPTHTVVRYSADAVDIEVVDEGRLKAPAEGIGRGLTGMRERVALFGGTLETGPEAGGGYGVHAHIPLDAED
jgi:signal transduction histidine kinase